jgi:hypothetical protein
MAGGSAKPANREFMMSGSPVEIPPGVQFVMVALGGFRGLLADALWVRASRLQDEGNVFEVAELTGWITRLEPRSPEVWSYHAWNLAYNITALFPDPADRWRWVNNGIRLLRDEGIAANPSDPRLYWELGWLYADKVAGQWDPAQLYYRASFANEMTLLMGAGKGEAVAVRRDAGTILRLASAGLLPDILAQADETYGPLDWRLPESHALYWALRGRPFQKPDSPWCNRLVWASLTEMVRGGALFFDPSARLYLRGPRLDIAVKGVRRCEQEGVFAAPLTRLVGEQFAREAMVWLYAFKRETEAAEAMAVLARASGSGGGATLENAVRQELSIRLKGVDRQAGQELVEGMLTRGFMWNALGSPEIGAGFGHLARLHWEALISLSGSGETEADRQAWAEVSQRARLQALREVPEASRATGNGQP